MSSTHPRHHDAVPGDRALVVLAHPEPKSFNAQLAQAAADALSESGVDSRVLDLYAEGFDPTEGPGHYPDRVDPEWFRPMSEQQNATRSGGLDPAVERSIDLLEKSSLLVLQFPLWWYGPPAMLKGWMDRVFALGRLYDCGRTFDTGPLRGRSAVLSVTTGSGRKTFEGGRDGPVDRYLLPVEHSLRYVGFDVLPALVVYGVSGGARHRPDSPEAVRLGAAKEALRRHLLELTTGAVQ